MGKKLSGRLMLFADEWLIDRIPYQAAIRAGYAEATARTKAHKWLEKASVREYINQRLAEKNALLIARQDEVLETLTRVMRRQECEQIVVTLKGRRSYYDENGKKVIVETEEPRVVDIKPKLSDVNKSAELLGKTYGIFVDRMSITDDRPIIIDNIPGGEGDG